MLTHIEMIFKIQIWLQETEFSRAMVRFVIQAEVFDSKILSSSQDIEIFSHTLTK